MTAKTFLAAGAAPRAFFPGAGFNMMLRGPQVAYAPENDTGGGGAAAGGGEAAAGAEGAGEGAGAAAGAEGADGAKEGAKDGGVPSIFDESDDDAAGGEKKEGEAAAGKEGEAKEGDGKEKEGEKPEGAPETYEAFTLPEGVTINAEILEAATPVFKELNLPQAQAQKLIDLWTNAGQAAETANAQAIQSYNDVLIKKVKEDPDLGGANLKSTLASAKTAIAKFGDEELDGLLKTTGFGNQPAVLRFLKKVADFDADDTLERGKGGSAAKPKFSDIYNPEIMKKD